MPHEKLQLVLRVGNDGRAHVKQNSQITLSRYEELHVYYLGQNGFVVAINTTVHQVYLTEHQLSC